MPKIEKSVKKIKTGKIILIVMCIYFALHLRLVKDQNEKPILVYTITPIADLGRVSSEGFVLLPHKVETSLGKVTLYPFCWIRYNANHLTGTENHLFKAQLKYKENEIGNLYNSYQNASSISFYKGKNSNPGFGKYRELMIMSHSSINIDDLKLNVILINTHIDLETKKIKSIDFDIEKDLQPELFDLKLVDNTSIECTNKYKYKLNIADDYWNLSDSSFTVSNLFSEPFSAKEIQIEPHFGRIVSVSDKWLNLPGEYHFLDGSSIRIVYHPVFLNSKGRRPALEPFNQMLTYSILDTELVKTEFSVPTSADEANYFFIIEYTDNKGNVYYAKSVSILCNGLEFAKLESLISDKGIFIEFE